MKFKIRTKILKANEMFFLPGLILVKDNDNKDNQNNVTAIVAFGILQLNKLI